MLLQYILAHIILFLVYYCHCNTVEVPSNCIGLSDGYYYFKLIDDDKYPIIYAKCSNEYLILDVSVDKDVKAYFNSFEMFHVSVAGPSNEYPINWNDWFLPNAQSFVISPECNSCDITHERQIYDNETVYMMTGSMFGCYWDYKNDHKFDQDFSSYECYYNDHEGISVNEGVDIEEMVGDFIKRPLTDASSTDDWDHSGVCAFNVRAANLEIPSSISHQSCRANIDSGYHLKPSIGTNGKHCVCAQPINESEMMTIEVKAAKLSKKRQKIQKQKRKMSPVSIEDDHENASSASGKIYYLYSSDFEFGTYRIKKPGRYILMEDILFNPNSGSTGDANDDNKAWRPHSNQQDSYPGAGQYRDPYFMGFFAAITVETSDVIIDLNDHTLAMDEIFYYQQRWFTLISLTSQYYLPGQGNGFLGANPQFASNVVIKDGILGLTSHHCIHGNFNKNVLIEHIVCRDFDTHGIQLNGFDHVTIRNVEIGPSSTKQFFRGEYGFARALLPRLQKVSDENPDQKIRFDQRENEVTMNDLINELQRQMNLIFDFVVNGNEPIFSPHSLKEQKDWDDIKALFYNPSGLPNGAALYGIYLNTNNENSMGYDLNTDTFSQNARLQNARIHDLRHRMVEYIRVSTKSNNNPFGSVYVNPLSAPYDAKQMFFSLDRKDLLYRPRYKGTIMTDILFALSEFTENWDILQSQLIFKDQTLPWAKGEDIYALNDNLVIGCNNDAMMQSGKGLMAIRMDGVQDASLSDIEIYNLFQETPLGATECGEYDSFDTDAYPFEGGHLSQKAPMQIGFSGNSLQGIAMNAADNIKLDNIQIHTLQSHTGDAIGISVWPSVNLGIEGPIMIDDINAGWLIPERGRELTWDSRPNRAPMACGISWSREYYSESIGLTYKSNIKIKDEDVSVDVSNVYGLVYCDGMGVDSKTMFGQYTVSENEQDKEIASFDDDEIDTDEMQHYHPKTDGHHVLVGTIIALSILFCGFLTMGYIAYIYFQHVKRQKEIADRAQILIQEAQQEMENETTNVQLQSEQNHRTMSNYQSISDVQEEENNTGHEANEQTPLIHRIPTFNRMNL